MGKFSAKIGFIGAGKVGTALGLRFSQHGYNVSLVSSHSNRSAEQFARQVQGSAITASNQDLADKADLVFITTPDGVIPTVAAEIKWHPGQFVIHCSGADTTAILQPVRSFGAVPGTFHPLQTFADGRQAFLNIPGSTFAIEAEEPLLSILKEMATAVDGRWIVLKAEDRALYHASAVIACNYLVTLIKMATDLWQTFGVTPEQATAALLPLIKGTLNNIENVGIPQCLTGPVARGDAGTISKHLTAISASAPQLLGIYRELGRQTIPIALSKGGINENQARLLQYVLEQPVPSGVVKQ